MDALMLDWDKSDIERRLGFESKKHTGVNAALSCLLGFGLTIAFYAALYPFFVGGDFEAVNMFFHGGPRNRCVIPYFTVFLTGWSVAILLIKAHKLAVQRRALTLRVVPEDPDFVLCPRTAADIIQRLYRQVDAPRRFILLDRIERSLANLKNIGRVGDVADGLAAQAECDENYLESTYTLVRGFIWAIPVLGFIGTVLGLAQAIGGFGNVVAKGAEIGALKTSLGSVTSGLSVAFETTLIALVAALGVQLAMTMLKQQEEDFLDACSDYCHRHIVAKLRVPRLVDAPIEND